MTWLLCDYGEVLSLPQAPEERAFIERVIGQAHRDSPSGPTAHERYWAHRPAYDRADLSADEYWASVLGREAGADFDALVAADVASWCRPNPASIGATARAAGRGLQLALLSNAPLEVAAGIDRQPWLAPFRPRLFSGRIGAVKPEPAYRAALAELDAEARDVIFVDDRMTNVEGAAALDIRAVQYTSDFDWDALQP